MSEHPSEGETQRSESTGPQSNSEKLPRRGYEGMSRPMAPPPPPPPRYPAPERSTSAPPEPPQPPPLKQKSYTPPAPPRQPATPQAPEPARKSNPGPDYKNNGLYLPCWSLVVMVLVVGAGAIGLFYLAVNSNGFIPGDQPPRIIQITSTPNPFEADSNFVIITTEPLTTPRNAPPTAAPIQRTAVPAAAPSATSLPGVGSGCPRDQEVRVVGTGTVGLSIRSEPVQADNILKIAREGERFVIVDGPQFSSTGVSGEVEYCRVQSVDDASVDGWAAREYLAEMEQFDQ